MKNKHKHDHHAKSVDLDRSIIRHEGRTYRWKEGQHYENIWYRRSRKQLLLDGEKVPFVPKSKREFSDGSTGHEYVWDDVWYRFKDQKIIKRLDRMVEKAEYEQDRKERKEREKPVKVLKDLPDNPTLEQVQAWEKSNRKHLDRILNNADGADDDVDEESDEEPSPKVSGELKRDKTGIKLFSFEPKTRKETQYFIPVLVNRSMSIPGYTSFRTYFAGKPGARMYTFSPEQMKLLAREILRGVPAKDRRELLETTPMR